MLRGRHFRRFYLGQVTSLLGTSMSAVAVTFAVLDNGGSAADVGCVIAAQILPQVVLVLSGGVLADRLGRRPVMLGSDVLRCAAQAVLAAALLAGLARLADRGPGRAGRHRGGVLRARARRAHRRDRAAGGTGQRERAPGPGQVGDRHRLPALAGLLVAVAGPAVVVAIDAASYGVSVIALGGLHGARAGHLRGTSLLREMAEGWAEFRSRPWLWATTVQFALFNLITWAPYLVLGPVLAHDYLGGARAWGLVMAATGAGAVLGGLAALGRRPRRPLLTATLATFGYPVPCLLLALHAPGGASPPGRSRPASAGALASALSIPRSCSSRCRPTGCPGSARSPPSARSARACSGWPSPGRSPRWPGPGPCWGSARPGRWSARWWC